MKKFIITIAGITLMFVMAGVVHAAKPTSVDSNGNETAWETANFGCTTIQSGELHYSDGHYLNGSLTTGFDIFGYNYQGHMFKGSYANSYLGKDGYPPYEGDDNDYALKIEEMQKDTNYLNKWYWPYRNVNLIMKWSDSWIANVSCDDDGVLDRGLVNGVLTNGVSKGWLTNHMEEKYDSNDDGTNDSHYTYFVKIGWVDDGSLWGAYDVLQEEYQEPMYMFHEIYTTPGLGLYDRWTVLP